MTMDLRTWLSDIPSAAEKALVVEQVCRTPDQFRLLLEWSLHEKDPLAWRAAWIMDSCDEQQPGLARPFVGPIIRKLPGITSTGVIRSLLRMLCRQEIGEDDQGLLIDLCFGYMVSELYPVAVKVHAMQIIYHHVLIYPELKDELATVIRDQIDNNSVGFLSRGRRILGQLEKIN